MKKKKTPQRRLRKQERDDSSLLVYKASGVMGVGKGLDDIQVQGVQTRAFS
jgi:hypothetical protein